MSFPDAIIKLRLAYAGGQCECIEADHRHAGRCPNNIHKNNRGRLGIGAWEAHHHPISEKDGGADTFENCRIYCWPCHEKTL